jgi:alpha-galactosidase
MTDHANSAVVSHNFRLLLALVTIAAVEIPALENGLARTPPMGWNTWYDLQGNYNDSVIRQMADAMVSSGMKEAGYQYINLDDLWQGSRDAQGDLQPDPQKFPNGMKAVIDYVHSKGLKFGMYSDAGASGCSGRIGAYPHYVQDAAQWAAWGADFVKLDWCGGGNGESAVQRYSEFRDAIKKSGRPMVFNICNWGQGSPWTWGDTVGNCWRTTGDIGQSVWPVADANQALYQYAKPGSWNDPDYLTFVHNSHANQAEAQSQFSIWSIMAAPLIAVADLRTIQPWVKDVLTNKEAIAVDQDSMGVQGHKIKSVGGLEVWVKPLRNSNWAVGLFNRSGSSTSIPFVWSDIGIAATTTAYVRDLWAHKNLGSFTGSFSTTVPAAGCALVRVSLDNQTSVDSPRAGVGRRSASAGEGLYAGGGVIVRWNAAASQNLVVTDMRGRIVARSLLRDQGSASIRISELGAGVYCVRAR